MEDVVIIVFKSKWAAQKEIVKIWVRIFDARYYTFQRGYFLAKF